jgi:sugar phosphate isomerase/epimerase
VTSRIGVCSWSLLPASAEDLAQRVQATGLDAVQLALDPVRTGVMPVDEVEMQFGAGGIRLLSGMMAMAGEDYSTLDSIRRTGGIAPDATWSANLEAAQENARLAKRLGMRLVTFHAGFVPHHAGDNSRDTLIDRLKRIADVFAASDVQIALETGQENAGTMLALMESLATHHVGVNFDPANMILYGMGDPVSSLDILAPFVRQLHVKDAISSNEPDAWGVEVPVGAGEVDWRSFFDTIRRRGIRADLVIEREAGDRRIEDVRAAAERMRREHTEQMRD